MTENYDTAFRVGYPLKTFEYPKINPEEKTKLVTPVESKGPVGDNPYKNPNGKNKELRRKYPSGIDNAQNGFTAKSYDGDTLAISEEGLKALAIARQQNNRNNDR